jgi:hypothetical protein
MLAVVLLALLALSTTGSTVWDVLQQEAWKMPERTPTQSDEGMPQEIEDFLEKDAESTLTQARDAILAQDDVEQYDDEHTQEAEDWTGAEDEDGKDEQYDREGYDNSARSDPTSIYDGVAADIESLSTDALRLKYGLDLPLSTEPTPGPYSAMAEEKVDNKRKTFGMFGLLLFLSAVAWAYKDLISYRQ